MDNIDNGFIGYIIIGLLLLVIFLSLFRKSIYYPFIVIITRWVRWISFSLVIAYLALRWELTNKPLWIIFLSAFLVWFLIETAYNWILIKLLNESEINLFPQFFINQSGDQWPIDFYFLNVRDWLRNKGFKLVQTLKTNLSDNVQLMSSIFEDPEKQTRLQVLYMPDDIGVGSANFIFSSITITGHIYITDNLSLPFGGYYPENWNVARKPLYRSLESLYKLHVRRIREAKDVFVKYELSPLEDINSQQFQLEKLNEERGFLYPQSLREEKGKITHEGCYRVWKEMWFIKYLGMSIY